MEENHLFNDRYTLERLLGRGNFSEVWLAVDTMTDIDVAIKIYAPSTGLDDDGLDMMSREFAIVVNANHKNLLKPLYYDTFDRKPYLILPFCKNGSITKHIGKFDEEQAWHVLRDVASGLAFLHSMNPPVIHQDIKPDNIMMWENGTYMISDFGISTRVRSTLRRSTTTQSGGKIGGTIAYMAPERFGKNGHTPIMASDIYSLGATVFELLTGDAPFGDNGGLIHMKGAEIPELPHTYSPDLRNIITRCLNEEPWKRPTAAQLEEYAEKAIKGEPWNLANEMKVPTDPVSPTPPQPQPIPNPDKSSNETPFETKPYIDSENKSLWSNAAFALMAGAVIGAIIGLII